MPRNAKPNVHKEKEFGIYVLWKSLPAHARGMKKSELVALGITDPLMQRIIKIKSQTEFAKYFSIKDLGTLTDWNARIKREALAIPSPQMNFQNQRPAIAEKIILPHLNTLQEKVAEQAVLVATLKRENALLKKKLKSQSTKASKRTTASSTETTRTSTSTTKPDTKSDESFYKSLKGLFVRKK